MLRLNARLVSDIIQGNFVDIHEIFRKHLDYEGTPNPLARVNNFHDFQRAFEALIFATGRFIPLLVDSLRIYLKDLTGYNNRHGFQVALAFDEYKRRQQTAIRRAFLWEMSTLNHSTLIRIIHRHEGHQAGGQEHAHGHQGFAPPGHTLRPDPPRPSGAGRVIQECLALLRQQRFFPAQTRVCAHYNMGECPHKKTNDSPICEGGFTHICLKCARSTCKLRMCAEPTLSPAFAPREPRPQGDCRGDERRNDDDRRGKNGCRGYEPYPHVKRGGRGGQC
jgi:hypothetical protein